MKLSELKNQEIEDKLAKIKSLRAEIGKLEREVHKVVFEIPYIYGRCIKELTLDNQSNHCTCDDKTTIRVGDIVCFGKYIYEYKRVTKYVLYEEFISIPISEEYFEFFTGKDVECRFS